MAVPPIQAALVGAYVLRQRLGGNRRFPLVLMLEPLFRCNLACAGCGKIDYPDPILRRRPELAARLADLMGLRQRRNDAHRRASAPAATVPAPTEHDLLARLKTFFSL